MARAGLCDTHHMEHGDKGMVQSGDNLINEILDAYPSTEAPPEENETIAVQFENVPRELIDCDQWVLWKSVVRDNKATKIPFSVYGAAASSTDDNTWSAFENVVTHFDASQYAGIGFVFTASDQFCGIDLDGCRDPETGCVADWADDEVLRFASYTEISPSQTGLKIWITADTQLSKGRKKGIASS